MSRSVYLLVAALLIGWPAAAPHAQWLFVADAAALYDDNVTRGSLASDILDDAALTLVLTGGRRIDFGEHGEVTVALIGKKAAYRHYPGLGFWGVGPRLAYRHKLGLGLEAPWLELGSAITRERYHADIRDSDQLVVHVVSGTRFSESWDGAIGVSWDRRYGRNDRPVVPDISGKVYDVKGHSAFIETSYAATDRLLFTLAGTLRRGDVVSTTRPNLQIFLSSSAIAEDDAFGDDFYAYRLSGTTRGLSVGASWAIRDEASLNLHYGFDRTHGSGGLIYDSAITRLSLLYRY